jgi:uncharacterized membrane protein YiaA
MNKSSFTLVGIVVFSIVLWNASQNASGSIRKLVNGFLGVLLLSMVILNWSKISPIFIKNG